MQLKVSTPFPDDSAATIFWHTNTQPPVNYFRCPLQLFPTLWLPLFPFPAYLFVATIIGTQSS